MGVPSQLSRCRLPRQLQDAALTPVAERGAEGHSSWFEMKSRHRERFYYYKKKKKKWFIWERHWDATSIPVRGSGAGRSQQICLKPARGGGGVAVSEAIEQQQENLNIWGVFLKLKVILRQPLSVFHCLSRTPPRSITFGKAPSVVKMFDRGLYLTPPVNNRSCQYSFFFLLFFFYAAALKWLRPFLRCLCPKCQVMQNNFTFTD